MYKYQLTIGLNDQNTKKQIISTAEAKDKIIDILINKYEIFGFTMFDSVGVYKMNDGVIVRENSIKIDMVTDTPEGRINDIIHTLAVELNQESIMIETSTADVDFLN